MSNGIRGSIEIFTSSGQSIGVDGTRWTLDAVPVVLDALYGITGLTSEPVEERAGAMPEAQWSAVDANNQQVTVVLWREVPFDETVIGQALAAAIAQGEAG